MGDITMEGLVDEGRMYRNFWSRPNDGFNYVKYLGGSIILMPLEDMDYIFTYSLDKDNPFYRYTKHPALMLLQKPRRIVTSRESSFTRKKLQRIRLGIPEGLKNWVKAEEHKDTPLFLWAASIIDLINPVTHPTHWTGMYKTKLIDTLKAWGKAFSKYFVGYEFKGNEEAWWTTPLPWQISGDWLWSWYNRPTGKYTEMYLRNDGQWTDKADLSDPPLKYTDAMVTGAAVKTGPFVQKTMLNSGIQQLWIRYYFKFKLGRDHYPLPMPTQWSDAQTGLDDMPKSMWSNLLRWLVPGQSGQAPKIRNPWAPSDPGGKARPRRDVDPREGDDPHFHEEDLHSLEALERLYRATCFGETQEESALHTRYRPPTGQGDPSWQSGSLRSWGEAHQDRLEEDEVSEGGTPLPQAFRRLTEGSGGTREIDPGTISFLGGRQEKEGPHTRSEGVQTPWKTHPGARGPGVPRRGVDRRRRILRLLRHRVAKARALGKTLYRGPIPIPITPENNFTY